MVPLHYRGVRVALAAALGAVALLTGGAAGAKGLTDRAAAGSVTFGAARTLAASGLVLNGQAPVAAINARGESVVAWAIEGPEGIAGRLFVRRGQPDGRFANTVRLGSDRMGSGSESVSVAPDGTAVVAWQDLSSTGNVVIEVAIARPGRPFGRPHVLASVGSGPLIGGSLTFPQVVALDRRITVVWGEQQPASGFFSSRPKAYLAAAIASGAGRFAPARAVPGTRGEDVRALAAGADPRGNVVAVYARPIGTLTLAPEALDYVVLRAGSAAFERPRAVPDPMSGAQTQLGFSGLSVGPGGVELSYTLDARSFETVRVTRLSAGAAFAPARTVGPATRLAPGLSGNTGATIALPEHGAALAAWTSTDWGPSGLGTLTAGAVNVATQRPNGSFEPSTPPDKPQRARAVRHRRRNHRPRDHYLGRRSTPAPGSDLRHAGPSREFLRAPPARASRSKRPYPRRRRQPRDRRLGFWRHLASGNLQRLTHGSAARTPPLKQRQAGQRPRPGGPAEPDETSTPRRPVARPMTERSGDVGLE